MPPTPTLTRTPSVSSVPPTPTRTPTRTPTATPEVDVPSFPTSLGLIYVDVPKRSKLETSIDTDTFYANVVPGNAYMIAVTGDTKLIFTSVREYYTGSFLSSYQQAITFSAPATAVAFTVISPYGFSGSERYTLTLTSLTGLPPTPTPTPTPTVTPTKLAAFNGNALYAANSIPQIVRLNPESRMFYFTNPDTYTDTNTYPLTCFRGTNYDFIVNAPAEPGLAPASFALRNSFGDESPVIGTYNNDTVNGKVYDTVMFTPTSGTPSLIVYTSNYPSITGIIIIAD